MDNQKKNSDDWMLTVIALAVIVGILLACAEVCLYFRALWNLGGL